MSMEEIWLSSEELKPWVVLQKIESENAPIKYLQAGPFSTAELKSKIYRGEFQFRDFVWRKGLDNWTLLTDIKELDINENSIITFPRKDPIESLAEEIAGQEISELPRINPKKSNWRDFEWQTPDLEIIETEKDIHDVPEFETFQPVAISNEISIAPTVTSKALQDLAINSKVRQQLNYYFNILGVMLLGAAGAYLVWAGASGSSASSSIDSAPTTSEPADSTPASLAKKIVWPAGQGVQGQQASGLEIIGMGLEGERPHLLLRTAAKVNDTVELWIQAGPGMILSRIREELYLKLTATVSPLLTVELRPWQLPMGEYRVFMRYQNKSVSKRIFIGKRNQQFSIAMARFRAALKHQAQSEKGELLATVVNLSREFQDLQTQALNTSQDKTAWDSFFDIWQERWSSLIKASRLALPISQARSDMVFADIWQELQSLVQALQHEAARLALARAQAKSMVKTSDSFEKLKKLEMQIPNLNPWDPNLF